MMFTMKDQWLRWYIKPLLFGLSLLPAGLLLQAAINDDLGANPVETLTHATGDWGLRFLLLTLCITPLRTLLNQAWLVKLRRMLGLFAFFYGTLHLLTYFWLDQYFEWEAIVEDIVKRPYITIGFSAWLMLLPLALTSTKGMMKRLGKRWKSLHQLVYPASLFVVLHFLWLVKADTSEPLLYLLIFTGLLLVRSRFFKKQSGRKSSTNLSVKSVMSPE